MLMVLILFLNDFLTMSISTDRMGFSPHPNRWNTRGILLCATVLAACKLVFSLGVFLWGHYALDSGHAAFADADVCRVDFEFAGGRLSAARARALLAIDGRAVSWSAVRCLGLGVMAAFVLGGILMPAISPSLLLGIAAIGAIYFSCLDWLKVWLFRRLDLR